MRATAKQRANEPRTPEQLRQELAGRLVKRAYRSAKGGERLGRDKLAEAAGIHPATLTTLTSGLDVDEMTWEQVSKALNWGLFLEYVKAGNIAAIEARCADVSEMELAVETLRQINETTGNQ